MKDQTQYLEGLNTLRFIAAFLVLIGHCQQNLLHYNIDWWNAYPFLYKGGIAVDFFFVLSGFLLTYLARKEYDSTGKINVKNFFQRRVLRIFPLYYLAVFLGYFLLGFLYPLYRGEVYFSFEISKGLFYHLFFLPNYIIAKYGENLGVLYSLWSIGVEEQFYLFFPFLMMVLFPLKKTWVWSIILTIGYFLIYRGIQTGFLFEVGKVMRFFCFTLKFHLMLYGCAIASLQHSYPRQVEKIVSQLPFQLLVWILFLITVFCSSAYDSWDIAHGIVFGLLVLVVSNKKYKLIDLEFQPLIYLGTISYGIYIFHPFLSYFLRLLMESFSEVLVLVQAMPWIYYLAEILLTIVVAHLSFQYFESFFLKIKSRLKT